MLEYEKMEQFWLLAIGGAVIMAGVASLGTSFAILPELKKAVKSQKKKRVQRIRLFQGVVRRRPRQNISTEALVN
ncbi:hypothetical protein [Holdemanella biformis]|nr:hypothetical protein [Holdemanella biformis]